jgi:hypothetical protein
MFTEFLDEPERTSEEIKKSREDRQSFIARYLSDESRKARRLAHEESFEEAVRRLNETSSS